MRFSKSFIFTLRENPKTAECVSQRLLLKGCFLTMISAGIYAYLPLGLRVLQKISAIIRKHMILAGAAELSMSALQPIELWQTTGRDKDLKDIMLTIKDRKGRDLCLGPTHEEEVTEIARRSINSYKQLPLILYQIQTKFRDEPRPRFGLMRSCEFIMKDAYSFDLDEAGLNFNYEKMRQAYEAIFSECGLNYISIEADSGIMGGEVSHEFMVPAAIGEDILWHCQVCGKYFRAGMQCCGSQCEETKMVEIGHIFKLGTKYSQAQSAFFVDKLGKRQPIIMGCYGIGVSRLLPVIAETNYDDKGIIWPKNVSPYDLTLIVLDDTAMDEALYLEQILEQAGISVLVDDRKDGAGVKFNDAYLIGNPYIAIIGKNYAANKMIDLEIRRTKEKLSLTKDEFVLFLKKMVIAMPDEAICVKS